MSNNFQMNPRRIQPRALVGFVLAFGALALCLLVGASAGVLLLNQQTAAQPRAVATPTLAAIRTAVGNATAAPRGSPLQSTHEPPFDATAGAQRRAVAQVPVLRGLADCPAADNESATTQDTHPIRYTGRNCALKCRKYFGSETISTYLRARTDLDETEIRRRFGRGDRCFVSWTHGRISSAVWYATGRSFVPEIATWLELEPQHLRNLGIDVRQRAVEVVRAEVAHRPVKARGSRRRRRPGARPPARSARRPPPRRR